MRLLLVREVGELLAGEGVEGRVEVGVVHEGEVAPHLARVAEHVRAHPHLVELLHAALLAALVLEPHLGGEHWVRRE